MRAPLLFSLFVCWILQLGAPAASAAPKPLATVTGKVTSIAVRGDGSVLVLVDQAKLLKVSPTGSVVPVALPVVPGEDPQFSDLAIQGNRASFCSFVVPKVFSVDLEKPDTWDVLELKGIAGQRPDLIGIAATPGGLSLADGERRAFAVDPSGTAVQLPEDSLLLTDPAGARLILTSARDPQNVYTWKLRTEKGRELLTRTGESVENNIQNLQPIGFDAGGRLLFLETTGGREFSIVCTLHAAKDGKIVFSERIDGYGLPVSRGAVLLPDGAVCLLVGVPDSPDARLVRVEVK